MENMSLVSEVNKIKYEKVTNSLFNIHLILLFSYFHFGSAKTFFVFNSQIVVLFQNRNLKLLQIIIKYTTIISIK